MKYGSPMSEKAALAAATGEQTSPICPRCRSTVELWTDLNHKAQADCTNDECDFSTFDASRDI